MTNTLSRGAPRSSTALFMAAEGASHPTASVALSGGKGQLFNAAVEVIHHARQIAHTGHTGGKRMSVDQISAGFRITLQQRFSPVAHVLPGAKQGECVFLL